MTENHPLSQEELGKVKKDTGLWDPSTCKIIIYFLGVSNGPIQFESARKIWPLLESLAKIRWVLACSCSQNFWKCSPARILVKIPCRVACRKHNLHVGNKNWPWHWKQSFPYENLGNVGETCARHVSSFCWHLLKLTSLSLVPGSRVTVPTWNISLVKRGNLLACKWSQMPNGLIALRAGKNDRQWQKQPKDPKELKQQISDCQWKEQCHG